MGRPGVEDSLSRLKAFVREVYRDKLEKTKELLGAAEATGVAARLGNGIEAFNSVPAAVCCFLRHPGSFEEAVVEAASLGGDADTIASMTGAWLGIEGVSGEWAKKLYSDFDPLIPATRAQCAYGTRSLKL